MEPHDAAVHDMAARAAVSHSMAATQQPGHAARKRADRMDADRTILLRNVLRRWGCGSGLRIGAAKACERRMGLEIELSAALETGSWKQ